MRVKCPLATEQCKDPEFSDGCKHWKVHEYSVTCLTGCTDGDEEHYCQPVTKKKKKEDE